jgi:hypothetical protein
MVIMDEARSFDLTDQQREYLSVLADATERHSEQVWEANSLPPMPPAPTVTPVAGTVQISWDPSGWQTFPAPIDRRRAW